MASGDILLDETFHRAIVTTWQQCKDSIALQPTKWLYPRHCYHLGTDRVHWQRPDLLNRGRSTKIQRKNWNIHTRQP